MAEEPSRPFELIIFDWDGTLMDSLAAIVACLHQATDDLGLPRVEEERIRRTVGLGMEDTMEALGFKDSGDLWKQIVERYGTHWRATFGHRSVPFPGAADALRSLFQQGLRLAVATGKSRRGLRLDLESTGFEPYFHATRTADETFPKPHPRMLEEILAELGVRREAALMVGDTTYDLEMAAHAGVPSVAVTSGSHTQQDLLHYDPLACLSDVTLLQEWLRGDRLGRSPLGLPGYEPSP